ncbi:MAG: FecR domain-containing protein [Bacteroides heparinolyticus]|nr:FecR domain-containing protein [Bacteroides heparinolyticus]
MKQHIPWDLIIACLSRNENDTQARELEQWTAVPENRALYEQLSQLWTGIQKETEAYTPDKEYYWRKLQARMHEEKALDIRGEKLDVRRMQGRARKAEALSAYNTKTTAENRKSRKLSGMSFFLRYVAAASIVLAVITGGIAYYTMREARNMAAQEVQFANLNGKSQVLLADGTKVWLHNNTSLNYRRLSLGGNREVSMSGEAFFEVSHDARHPFVVQMDGVKLTVYGTKFNIRNMEEQSKVQISLIEGSVGLETSRENRKMHPGETALFDRQTNTLQIESGDVNFDCLWAQKQIVFNQKTLGYISRYLSKWYNVEIELAPELADKYLYTFTLRDEPLEEIMRLIARINPVYYQFDENNKLLITAGKAK